MLKQYTLYARETTQHDLTFTKLSYIHLDTLQISQTTKAEHAY